jgi:hypothetical protein
VIKRSEPIEQPGEQEAASPAMADLQQHLGRDIGFANPMLYAMFTATPGAFHDIQHVANAGVVRANFLNSIDVTAGYAYIFRSFDFTTGLTIHTVAGYDNVTGIGSPNGVNFFQ